LTGEPSPRATPATHAAVSGGPATRIRRGVRVFIDEAPAAAEALALRLQLGSGTERLAVEHQQGTKYEKGIFVPRDDWRGLSLDELALVTGSGSCSLSRDIRVFAIPPWLHRFFWDLEPARLLEGSDFSATADDRLFNAFCAEATAALETLGIAARRLTVRFQRGRGRSTTFDPEFGTFVGLHVDNFERRPIDVRHRSFPRMVVNLGFGPRSLVFINLPLFDLFEPSGIPHNQESYRRYSWAYPLAHAFMTAEPDYPVLRLLLRPGEGYSAPTQNIIHDGYTWEATGTDVVLSGFVRES